MSNTPHEMTGKQRRFRGLTSAERRAARRDRLIQAGLEAFGTRGFHATKIRDLCAAAGLTERYFYESFDNREALFAAVYAHGVELVQDAVRRAHSRAGSNVERMTRDGLRTFLTLVRDDPRLARVLLIDVLAVGVDVSKQSLLVAQTFADMIANVIESTYPRQSYRKLDARLIANGLVGSTIELVMIWAANGFEEPLEEILDHAALFYDSLRHHLFDAEA